MISLSGSRLRFRLKTGSSTSTLGASPNLPTNQWVHIAAVYDGSKMRIYQNGVQVGSMNKTGNITQSNYNVLVGANPNNYSVWNGKIDEVVIYQRALSATEVASLASQ